jgi:Ca2+-transporting ATPase
MILVLLGAAVLSVVSSGGKDWLDAGMILLIVVLNGAISVVQESNAERALDALQALSSPKATVVRDGERQSVEAEALVPGDLVVLEAGMLVPADGRLLSAAGLRLDESALTGESTTVEKQPAASLPPERPLAERSNMVYASTSVTAGRGLAVVTATGMETEVGHIAALAAETGGGV